MEYTAKAIRILEFDKVIEQLSAFVRTESGKEASFQMVKGLLIQPACNFMLT